MRITIEMHGPLQRFNKGGQPRAELDLEDNLSVHEVLLSLGMDMDEPWNAALNGTLARPGSRKRGVIAPGISSRRRGLIPARPALH